MPLLLAAIPGRGEYSNVSRPGTDVPTVRAMALFWLESSSTRLGWEKGVPATLFCSSIVPVVAVHPSTELTKVNVPGATATVSKLVENTRVAFAAGAAMAHPAITRALRRLLKAGMATPSAPKLTNFEI